MTPTGAVPQRTTYTYQATGGADRSLVSTVLYPDGTSESYAYDNLGDVITDTNRNTVAHNYTYDAAGRELSDHVTIPAGVQVDKMTFPTNGGRTAG